METGGTPVLRLSDLLHHFRGGADGLVDVGAGVGGGDEAGFELRGREIDAFVEHAVEIFFETFTVAFHGVGEAVDGFTGEVAAEHGATGNELHGEAGGFGGVAHAGLQLLAKFFEVAVGIVAAGARRWI